MLKGIGVKVIWRVVKGRGEFFFDVIVMKLNIWKIYYCVNLVLVSKE